MSNLSRKLCLVALLIIGSVVSFYAFNLFFTAICNYQAVTKVTFSGFPMYCVMATIICLILYTYRLLTKKENTFVLSKHYAIALIVTSTLGIASSVLVGAWVYHSFTKEWIFSCYPIVMIIIHALILCAAVYLLVVSIKQLKKNPEEKKIKVTTYYVFYHIGLVSLLLYALNRAGAFLFLPIFWSMENSWMMIPFYVQLLAPLAIVICHCLYKDFIKEEKKQKLVYISITIIVGYSLFSMVYTSLITSVNYPNAINVLSPILQFERLVMFPLDYIAMYLVCLSLPMSSFIRRGIKDIIAMFKEAKENC